MLRISKERQYLKHAWVCATRGTCLRRNFGAVIVKNDEIISTGYTGSPRNGINCCDHGKCLREELGIPSGQRYELCRSVHAEMNACLQASRSAMIGSTMYLCGIVKKSWEFYPDTIPCDLCKRVIINSGIEKVVIQTGKNDFITYNPSDWLVQDFL